MTRLPQYLTRIGGRVALAIRLSALQAVVAPRLDAACTPAWEAENLTANFCPPGKDCSIQGNPVAITPQSLGSKILPRHVFGRNAYGDVLDYFWDALLRQWAVKNLNNDYPAIGSVYHISGYPVPIELFSGVPTLHVFGHHAYGDVLHYSWDAAAGWQVENLTTDSAYITRIGPAYRIGGDPVVNTSDNSALRVFGRNTYGHVLLYSRDAAAGWQAQNLTTECASIGTNYRIANIPVVEIRDVQTPEQVYGTSAGDVIHYCSGLC